MQPVSPSARADRTFVATLALLVSALTCSVVVIVAPRPVEPSRLPTLRLATAELEALQSEEAALAHSFVPGVDGEALLALYARAGEEELAERVELRSALARGDALTAELLDGLARLEPARVRGFIAYTLARAMEALDGWTQRGSGHALLGRFPQLLQQYGYADRERRVVAPEIVIRTLYKLRLNLVFNRGLERDLTVLERRAYHGYNALHAGGVPPERRAQSARSYFAESGVHAREALAIWSYQGGSRREAIALLRREHEQTKALRVRNMLLFAQRHE